MLRSNKKVHPEGEGKTEKTELVSNSMNAPSPSGFEEKGPPSNVEKKGKEEEDEEKGREEAETLSQTYQERLPMLKEEEETWRESLPLSKEEEEAYHERLPMSNEAWTDHNVELGLQSESDDDSKFDSDSDVEMENQGSSIGGSVSSAITSKSSSISSFDKTQLKMMKDGLGMQKLDLPNAIKSSSDKTFGGMGNWCQPSVPSVFLTSLWHSTICCMILWIMG